MRSPPLLAGLTLLLTTACMAPAGREAREATAAGWARTRWGYSFDLSSYHGQALPAVLPNGDTLASGSCNLRGPNRDGWVNFSIILEFPPRAWWASPGGGLRVEGWVWEDGRGEEVGKTNLLFVRSTPDEYSSPYGKFSDFPLDWRDGTEAWGTMVGDSLIVGRGKEVLVFQRRKEREILGDLDMVSMGFSWNAR